jgi:DnaJ homolog subfamily C member 19
MKFILFAAMLAALYYFGRRALMPPGGRARAEAARLLGVQDDADNATILSAHRRLIAKVHPDAGGSEELAARINQARDTLLRG